MRHAPGKGKAEILVEITDEEDVFEDPDIWECAMKNSLRKTMSVCEPENCASV
jgi:hypothetical protein